MRFPCFKAYFLEVTSHWRTFYKTRYTGCIFKMCRNFTQEVVKQRRTLKAIKKNCSSKIKCHFKYFFTWNFLNIFSESSSSWLKFCHAFQGHLYTILGCLSICVCSINSKTNVQIFFK
jgi:hypothetical protein